MRSTRCFEFMQNPSPSIELFGCSARYHEQVRPCARFVFTGTPSRERTAAESVPTLIPSTDFVNEVDDTPRPIWTTPPEDVTCLLDPQPAVITTQNTARRAAALLTSPTYTSPTA